MTELYKYRARVHVTMSKHAGSPSQPWTFRPFPILAAVMVAAIAFSAVLMLSGTDAAD